MKKQFTEMTNQEQVHKLLNNLPFPFKGLPLPKLKKVLGNAETYLHKEIKKQKH